MYKTKDKFRQSQRSGTVESREAPHEEGFLKDSPQRSQRLGPRKSGISWERPTPPRVTLQVPECGSGAPRCAPGHSAGP